VFKVKIVLSTPILLENPPHRQAAKRCAQPLEVNAPNKMNLETNSTHFATRKLTKRNGKFKKNPEK
jgi:hypothetical protein